MRVWARHYPRLEPLESRLQPGSILPGILELPSPDVMLLSPETDLDADRGLELSHHRRSPECEAAPVQSSIAAAITNPPAVGVICSTPWQPQDRPATPARANPLPPWNLIPKVVPPSPTNRAVRLTPHPAIGAALGVPAVVNPLPIHLTPVRPKVVLRHTPPVPGGQGGLYVSYAPAANPVGPSEGQAVAATKEGTAFVTGWTVDANGQQDLFVERTTLAGDATSIILAAPDGSSWAGQGIVVTGSDTTGTVYVVGNAVDPSSGAVSVLAASLNAADLAVTATITLSGTYGDVTGQALNLDSQGRPVLTGQGANAGGSRDLAAYRLDAGLTRVLNSVALHLSGPGDSGGKGIALDSADQVYIGGSLDTSPTNTAGLYVKFSADLQSFMWGFTWNNVVDGRNGAVNGVAVSGDFLYMTGFIAGNSGTRESHDLLLAKVDRADGQLCSPGYALRWPVGTPDQSTGDFGGHAIAVDTAGQAFVAADMNAPPDDTGNLDINGQLVEFSPTGDQIVGAVTYGNQTPGTTAPDRDYGVALQSTNPGDNVFSAGWTESDVPAAGFPITANAARSVLATAGHDGWDAAVAQPLPAYP